MNVSDVSAEQRRRHNALYLQHPDTTPLPVAPMDYLLHAPGRLAATSTWLKYRDETLLPLMQDRPDDLNLPLFLARTEEILAWRAGIGEADRFWRSDPE